MDFCMNIFCYFCIFPEEFSSAKCWVWFIRCIYQSCLYCWLKLWFKLLGSHVWLNICKLTKQKCTLFLVSTPCSYQGCCPFCLGVWCIWNLHGEVLRGGLGTLSLLTSSSSTYSCIAFLKVWGKFNRDVYPWMSKAFPWRVAVILTARTF